MDDLTKHLMQAYNLPGLRKNVQDFPRYQDREMGRDIVQRHAKIQREAIKTHINTLPKKTRQAAEHIAKQRGIDLRKLIKAKDPNSKARLDALKRRANREVYKDHSRRMGILQHREAKELVTLVDTVRQRTELKVNPDKPKMLTDRRADRDRNVLRPRP